MKKHKHHIVPKHAGGVNSLDNLIELTVEEHAEAHRILYKEHGRWQDFMAWKALSGQIKSDDIRRVRYFQKNIEQTSVLATKAKQNLKLHAHIVGRLAEFLK